EDLGVRHRLWVYSGRRGVHCWVCDDEVRRWSPALRAAAVEYLSLVKVARCWPWSRRISLAEGPQGAGSGGSVWGEGPAVLAASLDRQAQHRDLLQAEFPRKRDSAQRWELLRGRMERTRRAGVSGKGSPCYADWEVMLQFCFPRLDINVSKGVGHLLKSPFSVHPKTGGAGGLGGDRGDPRGWVSLCQELDAASEDAEESAETEPKRRAQDYRRTSLAPYVRVFEQFVKEMEHARRGELRRRSGESRGGR
ncbi:PRI1 primase, partial [Psilopogon haemacephalus]|nr:PRI1 primase [Psilopogon haemacephalus]